MHDMALFQTRDGCGETAPVPALWDCPPDPALQQHSKNGRPLWALGWALQPRSKGPQGEMRE